MKTRKRISYWVIASLAASAIMGFACALRSSSAEGFAGSGKVGIQPGQGQDRSPLQPGQVESGKSGHRRGEQGSDSLGLSPSPGRAAAHPNDPEVIDALTWPVLDVMAGYYPWADNEFRTYLRPPDREESGRGRPNRFTLCDGDMVSYASPSAKRFLITALEQSSNKTILRHLLPFAGVPYTRLASIRRSLDDPLIRDLAVKAHSPTPRGFLDQIKQADPEGALDREAEVYFEPASSTSSATSRSPSPALRRRWARSRRGELFELRNLVAVKWRQRSRVKTSTAGRSASATSEARSSPLPSGPPGAAHVCITSRKRTSWCDGSRRSRSSCSASMRMPIAKQRGTEPPRSTSPGNHGRMARMVRLQSDGECRAGPRTMCSMPRGHPQKPSGRSFLPSDPTTSSLRRKPGPSESRQETAHDAAFGPFALVTKKRTPHAWHERCFLRSHADRHRCCRTATLTARRATFRQKKHIVVEITPFGGGMKLRLKGNSIRVRLDRRALHVPPERLFRLNPNSGLVRLTFVVVN